MCQPAERATGILAIPLAVPLLFGLLLRRPTSLSLVLAVVGGAGLALVLNFWEPIQQWLVASATAGGDSMLRTLGPPSWEVATLATIAASVLLFYITGWLARPGTARQVLVEQLFQKLRTPIDSARIPSIGRCRARNSLRQTTWPT